MCILYVCIRLVSRIYENTERRAHDREIHPNTHQNGIHFKHIFVSLQLLKLFFFVLFYSFRIACKTSIDKICSENCRVVVFAVCMRLHGLIAVCMYNVQMRVLATCCWGIQVCAISCVALD